MFELNNSTLMEKSLDALWLRQKVISNNIANVDTPDFKSSEVVFDELLDKSMLVSQGSKKAEIPDAKIVQDTKTSAGEDGNNVDIDKENIELYRVQIQYEYMVRKLTAEYSNIKIALTGGKS
jgi:flagellar basal-body rod protein FlgB